MKTFGIVSDFHIFDKSPLDTFQIDEQKMIRFFAQCIKKYDLFVLNGDMLECYHPKTINERVVAYHRIQRAYPDLTHYIATQCAYDTWMYIRGNHDSVLGEKGLLPNIKTYHEETVTAKNGKKVRLLIKHGHQGDIANYGPLSFVGKFIAWVVGWLQRFGWRDAENDLSEVERKILPDGGPDASLDEYAEGILNKDFDLVVLGHTHGPKIRHFTKDNGKAGWYVNTGCCDKHSFTLTEITIDDDGEIGILQKTISM